MNRIITREESTTWMYLDLRKFKIYFNNGTIFTDQSRMFMLKRFLNYFTLFLLLFKPLQHIYITEPFSLPFVFRNFVLSLFNFWNVSWCFHFNVSGSILTGIIVENSGRGICDAEHVTPDVRLFRVSQKTMKTKKLNYLFY